MSDLTIKLFAFICLLYAVGATAAQKPVLVFSDLISAPGLGWSIAAPNKGAVVTVWGRNLGNSRAGSFITVNGTQLKNNSDYLDTWGKTDNPVPFLQSITFQLNNSMNLGDGTIAVTINGVESNTLPFRINQSKVNFVDSNVSGQGSGSFEDPYSDPMDFINSMSPGDVLYFRQGLYDEKYDGGKSVIWIRNSKPEGTAQDPIGFVAYPGEVAHLDSLANGDVVNFNRTFQSEADHITIAKLRLTAHLRGIWTSHYNRVIGNDVTGVVDHAGGSGAIHTGAEGPIILGNSVHGARSGNKLDHAVYIDGCQDVDGGEIAYNYVWDNSVGNGPLMVDNHQNDRCSPSKFQKSNYWHNNVISAENYKSRCLGIYDLSWDDGEAQEPDPAYVFNNIFIECGNGWNGAMYHINGHAFIYNNTFFNSRGTSIQLYNNASNEKMLGATIVNNIFIQKNGVSEDGIVNNGASESRIHVDNNYYENSSTYASDANAVTGTSALAVAKNNYSPVTIVDNNSSLINAGSTAVLGVVDADFYRVEHPSNIDIGAVEYFVQPKSLGSIGVQ